MLKNVSITLRNEKKDKATKRQQDNGTGLKQLSHSEFYNPIIM